MTQTETYCGHEQREASGAAHWAWIPGLALLVKASLFGAAFGAVALYSYLIHPGEELAFYQEKAQIISPIVAIVLGFALVFLASRFLVRRLSATTVRPAGLLWLILVALDVPFLLISPLSSTLICLLGWISMAIAGFLGARQALPGRV